MNQSISEERLIESAVSEGASPPVFHLLDLTTQFHSMAFAMMAVYVVLGFKQCRYHKSGIWNLALILCMFAYTIRAMLVGYFPSVAHFFNSVEYMTPVFFMICTRVNFDDDFVFGWVERCVLGTVGVLAFLFAIYEYIGTSEAMYSFQRQSRFALDALADEVLIAIQNIKEAGFWYLYVDPYFIRNVAAYPAFTYGFEQLRNKFTQNFLSNYLSFQ